MKKISIIGSGRVGATTAYLVALKEIASVLLLDVIDGLPQGTALDMMESAPLLNFKVRIEGSNSFEGIVGSDLVVITAGQARRPGMSRSDLLTINARIVSSVVEKIAEYTPQAIILVVTNPLDLMTYLAYRQSKFSPSKVIGMGGALDSSRMAYFVASALSISADEVEALVIGSHSDEMVPLPRLTKVGEKAITELLDSETVESIAIRTKEAGAEIVSFLKTGSAFYAPAAAITRMAESILMDEKKIFSSCVYLDGQYGFSDLCLSVPVRLGAKGVEEIIQLELSVEEKEALEKSAESVKQGIEELKALLEID